MTANQPYLGLASIAMYLWKQVMHIHPTLYHVLQPGQVAHISLDGNVIGTPRLPEYHLAQQCWMERLYQASCQPDNNLVMIGDADVWPLRPQFFDDLQTEARKNPDQIIATAYGMGPRDRGRLRACHLIGYGKTWKRLIPFLLKDWSDKNGQISWVELDKQQWWPKNCPVYVHMPRPKDDFYATEAFQDILAYIRGIK